MQLPAVTAGAYIRCVYIIRVYPRMDQYKLVCRNQIQHIFSAALFLGYVGNIYIIKLFVSIPTRKLPLYIRRSDPS